MTKSPEQWDEQRSEKRRQITGVARLAQRTRVILGGDEERVQACKILDASNSGFRIALKPMPKLEIGDEIILEHTDGTQQRVCVCWVSAHEVGLKVVAPDRLAR